MEGGHLNDDGSLPIFAGEVYGKHEVHGHEKRGPAEQRGDVVGGLTVEVVEFNTKEVHLATGEQAEGGV